MEVYRNTHTIMYEKGISRGAEWCKNISSEELWVHKKSDQKALLHTLHGFWPETEKFYFGQTSLERASKVEQNGTNFSFLAPSSEE